MARAPAENKHDIAAVMINMAVYVFFMTFMFIAVLSYMCRYRHRSVLRNRGILHNSLILPRGLDSYTVTAYGALSGFIPDTVPEE